MLSGKLQKLHMVVMQMCFLEGGSMITLLLVVVVSSSCGGRVSAIVLIWVVLATWDVHEILSAIVSIVD